MNVLVCDDDKLWIDSIKAFTRSFFSKIKLSCNIKTCSNINENLFIYFNNHQIDIALLDIDLIGDDTAQGIELAKEIRKYNPYVVIIFITSHPEFALDSYKINAFGYLIKPFYQKEIEQLFKESVIYIRGVKSLTKNNIISFSKKIQLSENHIICLEVCNRAMEISTTEKVIKIYNRTLKEFKEKVGNNFIYVSRSVIINIEYIVSCNDNLITLVGGKEIFITNRLYSSIREQIEAYRGLQKR